MAFENNHSDIFVSLFGKTPSSLNLNENIPMIEEYMHDVDEDETRLDEESGGGEEALEIEGEEALEVDGEEAIQTDGTNQDEELDTLLQPDPQIGMIYESRQDVIDAYKGFAKRNGFDVAIRNSRKTYVMIRCSRGRKNNGAQNFSKRIQCDAHLNANLLEDGRWSVNILELDHNHELDPDMSPFMAGHRTISSGNKRRIETVDMSGVPVYLNIRMQQTQAGGPSNLGCSDRDIRNFIDQRRRLRLGNGDAAAIQNLFLSLQTKDSRFFHLMDIDDDDRLRNVMWIHPRSIVAYEDFHDVITFDTTYLVNRYRMPFATIVGVNHHNQSILLGCALLSHERSESFKWFFKNWLQAMGGIVPTAILTDQCESIKNALQEVIPQSIHRLCLWHILYKLPDKFKGIKNYHKTAATFKTVIYDSLSIAEFEKRWKEFLIEYKMSKNKWLKGLYDVRDRWVPIYLNHMFWAGMLSTQRSESMHAFFDSYINARSTLKSFVEQYEIAVTNKVHKELEADFQSKNTILTRRSPYEWKEQFGSVYTHNVFKIFQKEIDKLMHCNLIPRPGSIQDAIDGIERYDVLEQAIIDNWYHKKYLYVVEYRPNGGYVKCQCRKFECKGILCRHILKLFVFKELKVVNDRYVLPRWRKDVYRPHSKILFSGGYAHLTKEYILFQELEKKFEKCNELAFNNPARMKLLKTRLDELAIDLSQLAVSAEKGSCSTQQTNGQVVVLDPLVSKSKGRPKINRKKSTTEKNREQAANTQNSGSLGRGRGAGNYTNIGTQGSVA